MWPFSEEKQQKRVIKALRKCHCGEMSYGGLRADDAVHCNYCGAQYLIGFSVNPVAKIELIDDVPNAALEGRAPEGGGNQGDA